jgi:hypothetical protein
VRLVITHKLHFPIFNWFDFFAGVVPEPAGQMAQAGKSGPAGPPLQPLLVPRRRRPSPFRRRPVTAQPLQPAVRSAETLRLPNLPLPAPRPPRIPPLAARLPPRCPRSAAPIGGTLPFGVVLPDAVGQHFGGAATQAPRPGVHRVAAPLAGLLHGGDSPRRRQEELQHSLPQAESEGARAPARDAQTERRSDQLNRGGGAASILDRGDPCKQ